MNVDREPMDHMELILHRLRPVHAMALGIEIGIPVALPCLLVVQYYECRFGRPWTRNELRILRPLFASVADWLPKGLATYAEQRVDEILRKKSAVRYLCDDFPELFEVLEYSKEMLALDDKIEIWKKTGPSFYDYGEYWFVKERFKRHPTHSWWNLAPCTSYIKAMTINKAKDEHKKHKIGFEDPDRPWSSMYYSTDIND